MKKSDLTTRINGKTMTKSEKDVMERTAHSNNTEKKTLQGYFNTESLHSIQKERISVKKIVKMKIKEEK